MNESIRGLAPKVTLLTGGDNDTVRIENVDNAITVAAQPELPKECASRYQPYDPNTKDGVEGGTPGFKVSADITSPTNLKISSNNSSVLLNWNYSSKGSVKIEFYRIRGVCSQGGTSCGNYVNDIWNLPSNEGASMSLQLSQSVLGNPPTGGQWKFYISANNQTRSLSATEMSFDPVTL